MITVTGARDQIAATFKQQEIAEKRRKDRPAAEVLTDAHEAARAEMDAGDGDMEGHVLPREQESRKSSIVDARGAFDGPDRYMQPSLPAEPGAYDRPYLDGPGHAAPSPQHGPPNSAPLPPQARGVVQALPQAAVPHVVGTGPGAQSIAEHSARAAASIAAYQDL